MRFLLRALVLCISLAAVYSNTGVYFQEEKNIYAAYGSWILTFSIDIHPYKQHISQIHDEILTFEKVFANLAAQAVSGSMSKLTVHKFNTLVDQTNRLVRAELKHFHSEYEHIRHIWK